MANDRSAFLGIDVGTGSVRAALFDIEGRMLGMGVEPIQIWQPQEDYVEQSSEDIWRAAGVCVRTALKNAEFRAEDIRGIGFDATCSLVVLDASDLPVSVSPTGNAEQNIIVWMDHRAVREAQEITAMRHEVLKYVGGVISPEMETPKLLWLKRHLPAAWSKATRFFDLPDYLTYRATGSDTRSLCTTVCKWTYLGHEYSGHGAWSRSYFEQIGLSELLENGARKIGHTVRPLGESVGRLTEEAAKELGLVAGIPVGVSIIDAHAGGIGLLGMQLPGEGVPELSTLEERVALIGGTSSCHMAVSREPTFVPGIWGPYYSAMLPGLWLTEGGQSATGALIDHTLRSHARFAELAAVASQSGQSVYAILNERLEAMAATLPFPAALTADLHVLPDHHGNRSPRADASLRGMISGLKLSDTVDTLALLYLATIQGIAHGTKHIIDTMNAHGYRIDTIIATGGDTKNPLFVREHADITGCRVVLSREPEAVLLGAATLGAVACGAQPSVLAGMAALSAPASITTPSEGAVERYHEAKHRVFLRMFEDQMAYRRDMRAGLD
jgi:FGGY-family pentulose kinase